MALNMKKVYEMSRDNVSIYFKNKRENRIGLWDNIAINIGAKFNFNIKWKTQIKEDDFKGSKSLQWHEDNLFWATLADKVMKFLF